MSPSVSGELKLCESGAAESLTTTEWWDKSWNDDSFQWPAAYGWTAHCPSSQSNFLYLAGGYAVHLTKHQINQQESIRVHAKATILHEIAHYIRNSCFGVIDNDTPKKYVDTLNGSDGGAGGRCFEQLAFGCVLELYSGATRSCLFTTDYDSENASVHEIPINVSRKLLGSANDPPVILPSHGGPIMPSFQYSPSSSFPVIKPKSPVPTANSKIALPCTQTFENTAPLVPITGELLDRIRAYHERRKGFYCLKVRRLGFKRIMDEDHANGITTHDYVTRERNANGEVVVKRIVFPEELERGILPHPTK